MKRVAILLAFVALLAGLFAIATPWLLSSDMVKQRLASRIEELTGLKTTLKGSPKLSILPFLGLKLKDVVVSNPPDMQQLYGDEPFISMASFKGRLKLLPAIMGKPELADFKMIRPRFNLRITKSGVPNWKTSNGLISRIFSKPLNTDSPGDAENLHRTISASPVKLGNFEIINGIIDFRDERTGHSTQITSINANIAWPSTDVAVSASGSMVLAGEVTQFSGEISEPAKLLANSVSDIEFSMKSTPLTGQFSGIADLSLSPQITGKIKLRSPSVRQFLGWAGYDLLPGSTPGELTLESDMVATTRNYKFQNASLSMDGNAGTGFMDMSVSPEKRIKFAGTLAFDTLSFDPYFDALDASGKDGKTPGIAKAGLINEFDIDLRFSAKTATLGNITMTEMAATAQLRDGNVIIDVGEAGMIGGMVQAQLQAKEEAGIPAGEIKLNFIDVDLERLSQIVLPSNFRIIGKGSATVLLKSAGRNASQLMQKLNGSATITAVSGRIEGLDLAAIVKDGANAVFLDANEVLAKSTSFTKLHVGVEIANGIALLRKTRLEGDRIMAVLNGKADLWRKSLAMNGRVLLYKAKIDVLDDPENISLRIPFFVGGTLDAPLFAPGFSSPGHNRNKDTLPATNKLN